MAFSLTPAWADPTDNPTDQDPTATEPAANDDTPGEENPDNADNATTEGGEEDMEDSDDSTEGPYVASVCHYTGSLSSSTESLMSSTITVSSNSGYASLRSMYGSGPMLKLMGETNASGFSGVTNYIFYTPTDLCQLWIGNYWYFFKDGSSRAKWCRSLYTSPHNSYIYYSLGDYYTTYSKPGWGHFSSSYGGPVLNDAGIVMKKGHPYMLAVLTNSYNRTSDMTRLMRLIDKTHTAMVS